VQSVILQIMQLMLQTS